MTGKQNVAYIGLSQVFPPSSSTVVISSGGAVVVSSGRKSSAVPPSSSSNVVVNSGGAVVVSSCRKSSAVPQSSSSTVVVNSSGAVVVTKSSGVLQSSSSTVVVNSGGAVVVRKSSAVPQSSSCTVVVNSGGAVVVSSRGKSSAVVVSSGEKRDRIDVFKTQNPTKTLYKHAGGECSAKMTKTVKAGAFVDKRSGNHGFKQEVNYKSSAKVNDKVKGCNTEYETQVKVKKVSTYNTPKKCAVAPKSSSGYKSITYCTY